MFQHARSVEVGEHICGFDSQNSNIYPLPFWVKNFCLCFGGSLELLWLHNIVNSCSCAHLFSMFSDVSSPFFCSAFLSQRSSSCSWLGALVLVVCLPINLRRLRRHTAFAWARARTMFGHTVSSPSAWPPRVPTPPPGQAVQEQRGAAAAGAFIGL